MAALQLLADMLALAGVYGLVALGFVLVLNATGAVNFAAGDCVMAGGFAAVALARGLPVPGIVLLPILLAVMAALGAVLAVVAYLPLRRRTPEAVFVSTIAVGIMLQNGATLAFDSEPRVTPALIGPGNVNVGPVVIGGQALATLAVAALLMGATWLLLARTQLGRRLRATAEDREIAAAMGIAVNAMAMATFAGATALAGAAGLLLSNTFFVTPTEGANYMLKAYIATAIGGWGSIPGAVAGAMLIAAFEVGWPSLPLLAPALGDTPGLFSQTAAALGLDLAVLAILLVRPRGLLGEALRRA